MKLYLIAALVAAAGVIAMVAIAGAQQYSIPDTIVRDAQGRTTGTISRDSSGTQTFRNSQGQMTGTATTDSGGTTTFRDAQGRTTGTATRPWR